MIVNKLPKKLLRVTPQSSPPRAPSISDWLRQLAATGSSFGAHTEFDEVLFTVTTTVIGSTVTSTALTFDPDGVKRLYSRSSEPSTSETTVTIG